MRAIFWYRIFEKFDAKYITDEICADLKLLIGTFSCKNAKRFRIWISNSIIFKNTDLYTIGKIIYLNKHPFRIWEHSDDISSICAFNIQIWRTWLQELKSIELNMRKQDLITLLICCILSIHPSLQVCWW